MELNVTVSFHKMIVRDSDGKVVSRSKLQREQVVGKEIKRGR